MVLTRWFNRRRSREAALPDSPAQAASGDGSPLIRPLLDYGLAVLSVTIAVGLTLIGWETFFSRNPFVLFYAAVLITAWRGGFGPGVLASLLATGAIDFFLMPSFFTAHWRDAVQVLTFIGIAGMVSWLNHSRDRAMNDLRRAKAEADAANDAKDQFLAVLSHELRTPLTPVLGLASLLEQDPNLSEAVRDDVTIIRRNVELEARLIDDLLDITRIRKGKLCLSRKAVDLTMLIGEVVRICEPDAREKQIDIRMILPPASRMVNGDPARLQQILWNLLKNAIKFTPVQGQVTISCSDGADGVLTVDVIDSGVGIESENLSRIFNVFEQGGKTVTRRFGGIGLGLAISRALAEAHGGMLTASSEGLGQGACFTLTLPSLPVAAIANEARRNRQPETEPLKVLLVEDHPDTSEVMARLLRNLHHHVEHAGSVRAAKDLAQTQQFDVVISDIGLPDGSGIELMKQLSAEYRLKGIAMSGYGMEEDVRRSLHAGFHAHLTKPINIDLLENAIGELASYSRSA